MRIDFSIKVGDKTSHITSLYQVVFFAIEAFSGAIVGQ